MRSIHAGIGALSSIFLGAALLLGCSETGLERRPEPPGGEPPTIVDLAALGDGPGLSGFCGTIGSGGIRAIVPLGGEGAFAVAYGSGRIVIQEVGQTNALRTLSAHTSPITQLRVSSDNQLMVSAAEGGEVKLWRLADGQLIRVVQASGPFAAVALSPDGSRLALLRFNQVEVQRSIEGTLVWQMMPEHGGGTLAFSADGQNLLHGGDIVEVRAASDGQMLRKVTISPFGVRAMSRDLSRFLAMRSRTREVALLDGTTGQPLWSTVQPDGGGHDVRAASFSADDSQIAYVLSSGTLNIVRATDGSMVRQWTITDGQASAVAFSGTGTRLALGLAQGGFRAWDLGSGELLVKETAQPGHMGPATKVAFSPDGAYIGSQAATLGTDRSLKVWRTNDAALLYVKDPSPMDGASRSFAISPDSATIALTGGTIDKKVYLLNASDGSVKQTIENADATSLAFSPDGSWLIGHPYCSGCQPYAVRVWRVADAQEQPGFGDTGMHDGYSPAFSRDGSLLAATSEGNRSPAQQVAVWRVSDRKLLWSRPAERFKGASAAFSPDGRHLAVADGNPHPTLGGDGSGVVRIHISNTGAVIREVSVPGVRAVTYTPTGELVTAGDAGVRVWRASDFQPIAEAIGSFTAVAVAADGQRLVAAGRDGSLSLMCGLGRALQ
jgi:WD40 repeat protein